MTLPLFVLVDGRSGSGKTSLASVLHRDLLAAGVDASLFALEDIYPGWDGLEPAIETLARDLVPAWTARRTARWTPWDWAADRPADRTGLTPASDVVLIEGVGASSRPVTDALSAAGAPRLSVWVEAPEQARKDRALARDGETYAPHWDRWAAQESAWLAGPDAPELADATVDGLAPARLAPLLAALRPEILGPVLRAPWTPGSRGTADVNDDDVLARLYRRVTAGMPHGAWLDSSMAAPGPRNRQIIMAAGEIGLEYTASPAGAGLLEASGPGVTGQRQAPFFDWVSEAWVSEAWTSDAAGEGLDLAWILQLGYELRAETGTPDIPAAGPLERDARAFWPARMLVLDVETGQWEEFTRGEELTRGEAADSADSACEDAAVVSPVFEARDARDEYLEMIARCLEEIRLGNSYELCLTTALTAEAPSGTDSLSLFRRLRRHSPAPFGAHLRMFAGAEREFALVSSSPERFLSVDGAGTVTAEPIKGTRPRGATAAEDARLRAELEGSAKDRAENIMIVDLLRNDLGATADTGSVEVERLCAIEEYATVFQMVSTITASVRPGLPRGELLRAAFPPGSMTGCPKISSMEILHRLEGSRRGAYSGSLGYVCWDGSGDFNVVIRSLELNGGRMSLGLGGAITVDSDPAAEWDEVRAKSAGVLGALGSAFPGPGVS